MRLSAAEAPVWLPQAHAHNDYEHPRPLLDALAQGFCSVEADIFLVDGRLLVAHNRDQVTPDRTLEGLYLDPLRQRVKENGGRVYRGGPEFTLLIDLKQDWRVLYPVLRVTLTNYADILTSFVSSGGTGFPPVNAADWVKTRSSKHTNAVLVVISGDRDKSMFDGEPVRYAAYDGTLPDLDSNPAPELVPWISASWSSRFQWKGRGAIPTEELTRLRELLNRAHAQGRRLRFWGCPDVPNFWQVMHVVGVDLINTDDLRGLREFLTGRAGTVP
jgi:hypothetical protein